MKKVFLNTRVLAVGLAATLTTAISSPAFATDEKKAIPVELKFLGNIENQPVFELRFSNAEVSEYVVSVRDGFDNVLYRGKIKAGTTTQKFILKTEEIGDGDIKFEIIGNKSEKTVVYEVNKKSRLVEDLVINRAD